ncbi:MAG: folylpolyglutamate synthase [Stictis urceolatum]|nr:folylpolyglutamate synthase [Stictis urceolata]
MLELGLERIGQLCRSRGVTKLSHRVVHVAGTNGKGSVCAYTSSMLKVCNVRYGQFTSPHLIDRWDCICLDGAPVFFPEFREVENTIIHRNNNEKINATEFEILTATAFELFRRYRVDVAVVEVGLGGKLDATNILQAPLATVITKIGLDHQSLLGSTIEEIAQQKAGILKRGTPCFVDGTNLGSVKNVIEEAAKEVHAGQVQFVHPDDRVYDSTLWQVLSRSSFAEHQQMNIALAYEAAKYALHKNGIQADPLKLAQSVTETVWPGRLQTIDLYNITGQHTTALLDGAHNPQAAEGLGKWVNLSVRSGPGPVTWLIAATDGKDLDGIIPKIIRKGDNVVATSFGSVDGMPWVHALEPGNLLASVKKLVEIQSGQETADVRAAVRKATALAEEQPLVITGSLYLVSDILRLLRTGSKESMSQEQALV